MIGQIGLGPLCVGVGLVVKTHSAASASDRIAGDVLVAASRLPTDRPDLYSKSADSAVNLLEVTTHDRSRRGKA
jgi:hypothetical protein